ncbi:hypothetical protein H6G17_08635 [Chroococcidiopsis sp. FACHB-1243]|uniref:hypothetical protein n=1 Tax=Chroococcidiopsis sp. [FACHB-1243] TaxID=2692781 RepID=UPI00178695D9|nr:hypothetical protein [Chroococcidiopsis sp. [FACHB-1243]]MBD2305581.1 hypothetical protein [Chroococcidiopsis sp. [FACHB-1243]]
MQDNKCLFFTTQEVEAIFQDAAHLSVNEFKDDISYTQLIAIAKEVGISKANVDEAIKKYYSATNNSTTLTLNNQKRLNYDEDSLLWLQFIFNILVFAIVIIFTWNLIQASFETIQHYITISLQPGISILTSSTPQTIINRKSLLVYLIGKLFIFLSNFLYVVVSTAIISFILTSFVHILISLELRSKKMFIATSIIFLIQKG